MECWDAYDRAGHLTGDVLIRGEAIPQGTYHMVCEVLVKHADGDFLLMQRDPNETAYPGYWEATAGGSAWQGEDAVTCIRRELQEETGISCAELTLLARRIDEEEHAIFYSYLACTACAKDDITLQQGETVAYAWVGKQEFIEHLHSNRVIDRQKQRYASYFTKMGFI